MLTVVLMGLLEFVHFFATYRARFLTIPLEYYQFFPMESLGLVVRHSLFARVPLPLQDLDTKGKKYHRRISNMANGKFNLADLYMSPVLTPHSLVPILSYPNFKRCPSQEVNEGSELFSLYNWCGTRDKKILTQLIPPICNSIRDERAHVHASPLGHTHTHTHTPSFTHQDQAHPDQAGISVIIRGRFWHQVFLPTSPTFGIWDFAMWIQKLLPANLIRKIIYPCARPINPLMPKRYICTTI